MKLTAADWRTVRDGLAEKLRILFFETSDQHVTRGGRQDAMYRRATWGQAIRELSAAIEHRVRFADPEVIVTIPISRDAANLIDAEFHERAAAIADTARVRNHKLKIREEADFGAAGYMLWQLVGDATSTYLAEYWDPLAKQIVAAAFDATDAWSHASPPASDSTDDAPASSAPPPMP